MKKYLSFITFIILAVVPSLAFAAGDVGNLSDLITQLKGLINQTIPLLFGVALLGFMWGVITYIWAGGNATKLTEARKFIVFSIVAMAVMLSVWSLAFFLKDSFFPNAPASFTTGPGNVPINHVPSTDVNPINTNPDGYANCNSDFSDTLQCKTSAGQRGHCRSGVCEYFGG